jgi:ABC-type phosphate transport system permease subunit
MCGWEADPLSFPAVFRGLVHTVVGGLMAVLLIIMLMTIGLGIRAGVWGRRWSAADSENTEDTGLVDMCARTFALVLISLVGLFALGVMYGNVLGTDAPQAISSVHR